MKKIIFSLALFTLFTSSKKDKDQIDRCSLSETNLVGNYKMVLVMYKETPSSEEVEIIDFYLEPCEKDDITSFKSDNTYIVTDQGIACDFNSNDGGIWTLSGDNIEIDLNVAVVKDSVVLVLVPSQKILIGRVTK